MVTINKPKTFNFTGRLTKEATGAVVAAGRSISSAAHAAASMAPPQSAPVVFAVTLEALSDGLLPVVWGEMREAYRERGWDGAAFRLETDMASQVMTVTLQRSPAVRMESFTWGLFLKRVREHVPAGLIVPDALSDLLPESTRLDRVAAEPKTCPDCKGSGVYVGAGFYAQEACRTCGGRGVV